MKQLSEMSQEELWIIFPVIISKYNPKWPENFLEEKKIIEQTIGLSNIFRIHHFGSTSIPGICAKPTIDILIEIVDDTDTEELIKKLQSIGYIHSPQKDNPPPHMMFLKGYTTEGFKGQAYHVHIRYHGDWDELYFRDYLISHSDLAKEYGNLKMKLKEKFEHNRDAYTQAKTEFILEVTQKARKEMPSKYKPESSD